MADRSERHKETIISRLNIYILPNLGKSYLTDIKSVDVLKILRESESKGYLEIAKRVRQIIDQIFRFAVVSGWAETDPSAFLSEALQPVRVKHFSTLIDSADIKMLMKSIKAYPYTIMRCAMLFSIYMAARPGEVRAAEWSEIKKDVWEIPADKVKMKKPHIVPLSTQVKAVLEELRPLTGGGR